MKASVKKLKKQIAKAVGPGITVTVTEPEKEARKHNFKGGERVIFTKRGSCIYGPRVGDEGEISEVMDKVVIVKLNNPVINQRKETVNVWWTDPAEITENCLTRVLKIAERTKLDNELGISTGDNLSPTENKEEVK